MLTERQQYCLRGIGIPAWRDRGAGIADATAPRAEPAAAAEPPDVIEPGKIGDRPRFSAPASPTDRIANEKRGLSPVPEPARGEDPGLAVGQAALDTWDEIIEAIHACTACELSQNCTQKVPGVGDREADLLIVGEGPGHDEDIQGEPFVGRSGQLLDRMLAAIGFDRKQVYITNIVKCRPPNNRDPRPEEAQQCRAYLEAQIKLIAPKVILSVGRVSAHNLLGSDQPVGKLIRQNHTLPGTDIPVKVTYHPAYLLRNPSAKAIAWQDLKLLYQMLQ
ncbi:MAG: uracil-DNA glycosylase [Gammaproteobacteria bacterium]|jgi:DNA polymerase